MADILTFTNPKWIRLAPLNVYEANVHVVCNFLDWEIPRPAHLSVFEHKWLDRIKGYRNRDSFNYLNETRDIWDKRITRAIYG